MTYEFLFQQERRCVRPRENLGSSAHGPDTPTWAEGLMKVRRRILSVFFAGTLLLAGCASGDQNKPAASPEPAVPGEDKDPTSEYIAGADSTTALAAVAVSAALRGYELLEQSPSSLVF